MPRRGSRGRDGLKEWDVVDENLPDEAQKAILRDLVWAPLEVTGARDDPEGALADLLTQLAALGLITDSTTAS